MSMLPPYFKLLRLFWSTAIAAELEYRVNFAIATLTSVGNLAGSLFGLSLFYRTGYQFAGWSWDESLLVLGVYTILQGVTATILSPNLNKIVTYIQNGTLDFVLLKPVSSQFWLSTRALSPWGLPDLILGIGMVLLYGAKLGVGPMAYALSLIPILFSILILYCLWFILGTTSVWFVKIYNVTEVLRGLVEAGRYPITAFPVAYRFFFTFVVPIVFLTTVPAEAMLGRVNPIGIVNAGLLTIGLLFVSNRFWRFALRFYTSASS